MADPKSIIVATPKLTRSNNRVKKREPKAGKAFDALSYGVRRSFRLAIVESIEYARAAAAKATSSIPPTPSSPSTPSTPSSSGTPSMLSTPGTPSTTSTATTSTTPCTTPKKDRAKPKANEQGEVCLSPLVPTKPKNWYGIKGIINEASRGGKTSYLVEWDGYDPSTGMDWPAEWLDSSSVSKPAIKIWNREKTKQIASS